LCGLIGRVLAPNPRRLDLALCVSSALCEPIGCTVERQVREICELLVPALN
jgi:hypothetical protein